MIPGSMEYGLPGRDDRSVRDTVWVFTYYEMETAFSREDLLQAVAERQSK